MEHVETSGRGIRGPVSPFFCASLVHLTGFLARCKVFFVASEGPTWSAKTRPQSV